MVTYWGWGLRPEINIRNKWSRNILVQVNWSGKYTIDKYQINITNSRTKCKYYSGLVGQNLENIFSITPRRLSRSIGRGINRPRTAIYTGWQNFSERLPGFHKINQPYSNSELEGIDYWKFYSKSTIRLVSQLIPSYPLAITNCS